MRFASENVDLVERDQYRRLLAAGRQLALATVATVGTVATPRLAVALHSPSSAPLKLTEFEAQLRHILCTDLDLRPFYRLARKDKLLAPLVARFRGLRITASPTLFEALVSRRPFPTSQPDVSRTQSRRHWSKASAASGAGRGVPTTRFPSRAGSPPRAWKLCAVSG